MVLFVFVFVFVIVIVQRQLPRGDAISRGHHACHEEGVRWQVVVVIVLVLVLVLVVLVVEAVAGRHRRCHGFCN